MKWIQSGPVCREIPGTRQESFNNVSGVPVYNVRLEIPKANREEALAALLGIPETWPHITVFSNVRVISANIVTDKGYYTTDSDGQTCDPANNFLVDMVYTPRPGKYLMDESAQDQYWEDILEPRNESRPLDPTHFIWGNTDDTLPNDLDRTLAAQEAPVKYEPGETLTHIIEGWTYDTSSIGLFQGTCNAADYVSPTLNRTFESGTLLLKNVQITKEVSFRSYRQPSGSPVWPLLEFSGKFTPKLKFIYEYKKDGWQRFYRYDTNTNVYPPGYYYIRFAEPPYAKFEPFPLADHSPWLIPYP